jgi:amidase
MADELWRRGAVELAGMIAGREVSSREVVEAHFARIDEVNPTVNAVVRLLRDDALAAADVADRAVASGAPLGVLHGVPITVKENIDLAGTPTTQAVAALAEAIAPIDAPVVERMRVAGAIPIGRTNLPDFGLRIHTDSSLHGRTKNPWSLDRTAGGSSGGEGAALASGMSPLGLGNDIGGSLRNPAHCCGITSIKPSIGVVPHATVIPPEDPGLMSQLMMVEGVMARRVADVRAGFGVVAGPHHRDPMSLPVDLGLCRRRGERFRVAVMSNPPGGTTHPGVAAAITRAADALSDAGHDVVAVDAPEFEAAYEMWATLLLADLRALMPLLSMVMGPDALTFLGYADEVYPQMDLPAFMLAQGERHRLLRMWNDFFGEHPILLCPTWTEPAFRAGQDIESAAAAEAVLRQARAVMPPNLFGLPAVVVPAGTADGLPVGAQVVGPRFADLRCLDVAQEIESALGTLTPIDPSAA